MDTMARATEHRNADTLRSVYRDLARIGEFVSDDVVLHNAIRDENGNELLVTGKPAVVNHELALIDATAGTLVMAVEHIHANDFFGAVFGKLLVGDDMAMPFCGLWRFVDGVIVEHWENAYDAPAFLARLSG
jgi:hypothetical protein